MPDLHIIAGPNGAGKTTFALEFLPQLSDCVEFVNADVIAEELSPGSPDNAAFAAGRKMLQRIRELSERRVSFAFESTLAGRGFVPLVRRLQAEGYEIHLYYLWLQSVEIAVERVRERVHMGGHNVSEETIQRRFRRGLKNLLHDYIPLCDSWLLFDNSSTEPRLIAEWANKRQCVLDEDTYCRIIGE